MLIKNWLLSIFLVFLVFARSYSQSGAKWGKVSKSEIEYKECPFEPAADAVILSSQGSIEFRSGSTAYITKHVRIKILKENGIGRADVALPYYTRNDLEQISNMKAQTITIDASGKLNIQKVENNQIFDVKRNENWSERRFVFPAVKVGSIIEYQYVLATKNITFLEGWVFQDEIPTLYSEITANISESLDYRVLMQGARLVQKQSSGKTSNKWQLQDLPSIKEEPFTTNYRNYQESIRFQLAGYYKAGPLGAGSEYVSLMTSWESLAREVLNEDRFGHIINKSGKAKDILKNLNINHLSDLEKAHKIYDYVKNNYSWNDKYGIFPSKKLATLIQDQQGSTSEINLLLTLLLQEAGLQAHPALLSTTGHGNVVKVYPLLSQFNSTIAYLDIAGKEYLLDATDPFRPFDLLAENDLNEGAFVLEKNNPRWISIVPNSSTKSTIFARFDFLDLSAPKVDLSYKAEGYKSVQKKKDLYRKENQKDVLKTLNLFSYDVEIDSLSFDNLEVISNSFQVNASFRSPDLMEKSGDLIYLKPLMFDKLKENPFKAESRYYPVDFGYPVATSQILVIKVPEGYKVEETPEPMFLRLPEDYGSYSFQIVSSGESIQIASKYSINKTLVAPAHYQALREFYDLILAKSNQMVIFKKI